MRIRQLSKNSIKEFSKTLSDAGINKTVLEIFFDAILELIDPYGTNINQNLQNLMQDCMFEGMDDINKFLHKYNDFTNSSIEFINAFALIEDNDLFDQELEPVFEAFYHMGDYEREHQILNTKIDQILAKTIEVHEININIISTDDLIEHIESILGSKESAIQLMVLMSISNVMKEGKAEKDDLETLRATFIMATSFVFMLNELRKKELNHIEENKKFVPRTKQEKVIKAGRNDLCPCGSGKKYKKCCLNKKSIQTSDPLKKLDLPPATHFPLTRDEIDAFYSLWSRLINFSSKLLCETGELKYIKLYFQDSEKKYALTQEALKDNRYIDARIFLLTNFDRIVDEFTSTSRVSEENIGILKEWKKSRLYSDNFLIYENTTVGAIIWDVKSGECYHLYDLYDRVYNLSKKDTSLSMLLLPYKGRIIFDGVIGQMGIDFGQNMRDMFLKDYINLRKSKSISTSLPKQSSTTKIYQLKISIKGAKPPIWRRVLIEDDITFHGMHYFVQDLFEWNNAHLFEFTTKTGRYTDLEFDDGFMDDIGEDARVFAISDGLKDIGDKMTYLYDFGDYWEHEIKLEDILEKEEAGDYPRCIKGKGRGPLEDIGGIWAHNQIVQACKESNKEVLKDFYVEDDFDPLEFDLDEINSRFL